VSKWDNERMRYYKPQRTYMIRRPVFVSHRGVSEMIATRM
jgi:hypothetical protein